MDKICETCKNHFEVKFKHNPNRFCSNNCRLNRKFTQEERKKMSSARIGIKFTDEHKKNISIGKKKKPTKYWLGKKRPEIGKKISKAHRGNKYPSTTGPNHWNWKGGITSEIKKIRNSFEIKEWRKHVFQRDDYTCQACGERGGKLHADHELPFALFEEQRFEILNGRTLCETCHRSVTIHDSNQLRLMHYTKS